jgi:glycerol-3-phosphate dehydrogenase
MAEVLYAVTHEGALHLDDLLARRTRISVDTPHRGTESARAVADLVAPVLGWSQADIEREVGSYIRRVQQELASQEALNDLEAQGLRSQAPEARTLVGAQADRSAGPESR